MKANEFITLEMKQRLDAKCWKGKHKEGTKIKGGIRVNNCVPNESIEESEKRCQQCGMTNCKCAPGKCGCKPIAGWIPNKGFKEAMEEGWSQKYKKSINCSHPKGFSQKAHCAGKKKQNESIEMEMVCEDCGMCQTHGNNTVDEGVAGPKKCWPGHRKVGTQPGTGKNAGKRVNDCEKIEEAAAVTNWLKIQITQAPDGTYTITHTKAPMAALGTPEEDKIPAPHTGIPDLATAQKEVDAWNSQEQTVMSIPSSIKVYEGLDELSRVLELSGLNLTPDEQFDIIEEMVEQLAEEHGVDPEVIWEDFESVDDDELLESAAWRRSEGKSKKGGLNAKGVASYRRENPGSKLQTAVTTKPSKLKAGSKAAKRRKSFCARMGGVKGPMKKPNGKPTRKALALRKWNC